MRRGAVLTAAVSALLTAVLSGCGDHGTRAYSVPESLCGTAVRPASVMPFLPAGRTLSVRASEPVEDANSVCEVSVGKKIVFRIEEERREPGMAPYDIIRTQLHVDEPRKAPDGSYAYTGGAGVGLLKCRQPGGPREDISIVVQVLNHGRPGESAMKRFLPAYADSYARTRPCRDRDSSPAPAASG